jgi:hypothetical protein
MTCECECECGWLGWRREAAPKCENVNRALKFRVSQPHYTQKFSNRGEGTRRSARLRREPFINDHVRLVAGAGLLLGRELLRVELRLRDALLLDLLLDPLAHEELPEREVLRRVRLHRRAELVRDAAERRVHALAEARRVDVASEELRRAEKEKRMLLLDGRPLFLARGRALAELRAEGRLRLLLCAGSGGWPARARR